MKGLAWGSPDLLRMSGMSTTQYIFKNFEIKNPIRVNCAIAVRKVVSGLTFVVLLWVIRKSQIQ